jgi:CobQ/CobB/MinD/ParA family nucleotide binding protein
MTTAKTRSRIVFSQGGKGGVGKTTVLSALVGWLRSKGFKPVLLDFDTENREKSSFASFYPEATKVNIHAPDSLDKFFHHLESPGTLLVADQGAGAGAETFAWFDRTADIVREFADVTAIGVVTKDPGSVESVLTWGYHLGDRVSYLVALNELVRGRGFDAWATAAPAKSFRENLKPAVIAFQNRNPDFEDMLRANALTLEKVISKRHEIDWFKSLTRVIQARRYQQEAYDAFETVAELLIPARKQE